MACRELTTKSASFDGRNNHSRVAGGQEYQFLWTNVVTRQLLLYSFALLLSASPVAAWLAPPSSVIRRPHSLDTHQKIDPEHRYCRFRAPSLTSLLLCSAKTNDFSMDESKEEISDSLKNIQWELFRKHHAKFNETQEISQTATSWVGRWTTYDYVGDILLETMPASVNYICSSTPSNEVKVEVTHTISTGSVSSDCETCFDDPNISRTIPITLYTPETIGSKTRLGACSMIVGPSILQKSGTMATEIVLAHTCARVRIMFQHAPVWARGIEPGSCPPQGLKLVRCLVARETLHVPSCSVTPIMPGTGDHPIFDRSVPPFDWHKKWSGTSWTWGPEAGDRGWSIPELEIGVDDWHGSAPVEAWNLRLPGGIFIQLPRVITSDAIERCRLAWMPDPDSLLRVEAGVLALQPILDEDEVNNGVVGFEPPVLASLRCDVLQKIGDLEGLPSFVSHSVDEQSFVKGEDEVAKPIRPKNNIESRSGVINEDAAAIRAIDDALQF